MIIKTLPVIIGMFLVAGFAFFRYRHYKQGREPVAKLAAPLFLMLASLGMCMAVFIILLSLGLVH